jgi:hypothetical protein
VVKPSPGEGEPSPGETKKNAVKKNQGTAASYSKSKKEGALTAEQAGAVEMLLTVPGFDPGLAEQRARVCDLGDVPGWVAEGCRMPVGIAAKVVSARLRDGVAPPPMAGDRDAQDRRRYITGEFAEFVQH